MRQPCPDIIPRSGEKGKAVRCYTVYLTTENGDLHLLVDDIDETGFVGRRWDGSKFEEADSVSFSDVAPNSVQIERYLGLFSFTYSGIVKCVLHDWTYLNRLPAIKESVVQFFFERRDLGLTDRIETLQALVLATIENPELRVTEVTLPSLIHGQRWIIHPDKERQQSYARMLLSSFEESGAVEKDKNGSYRLTGCALTALSEYETEKQRHDQMLAQSRHMKWLTFALILVGAVNAGITYIVSST